MPIEIKNRFTQEVIFVVDAENLGRVNLSGANLEGANIEGADLFDADLIGVKILIEGHKIVILNQQESCWFREYIKRPYLYPNITKE